MTLPRLCGLLLGSCLTLTGVAALAQAPAASDEPGHLGLIADDRNQQGRGARVLEVVPGGPAEKGGVAVDDLITSINEQPIRDMTDMARVMDNSHPGQKLAVAVERGNEKLILEVVLGRRANAAATGAGELPAGPLTVERKRWLGVRAKSLTPEVREALRVPVESGALVTEVVADSPAAKAGLRVDAIIVSLAGQVVESSETLSKLVQAAEPNQPLSIEFYYDGGMQRAQIKLIEIERPIGAAPATPAGEVRETLPEPGSSPPSSAGNLAELERRVADLESRLARIEELLRTIAQNATNAGPALPMN